MSRPARQFPLNEVLLQGSERYNAQMPWSHRVWPLPAFASRRNRPRPGKAALAPASRLPKGSCYGSDETCNPTGKPSKSCLLPPSDKPSTHPGSSVATKRLDWSQQVLLKGLPASRANGNPLVSPTPQWTPGNYHAQRRSPCSEAHQILAIFLLRPPPTVAKCG
jgi:hypothetical protein